MQRLFIVATIFIIALGVLWFVKPSPFKKTPISTSNNQVIEPTMTNINLKASFAIFTNGTFRIFSDDKYHNQSSDVFIPTGETNIISVKKTGVTWSDFFKSLPMKLEKDCLTTGTGQLFCSDKNNNLKFYINGISNPDALSEEIKNGDKLLVSFGASDSNLKYELSQIPDAK